MIIILLLEISIVFSLFLLTQYYLKEDQKYHRWLKKSIRWDIALAAITGILFLVTPTLFHELDISLLNLIACGFIMMLMLNIQVQICINIYRESHPPANTQDNESKGEISHRKMTPEKELGIFLGTIPFLLLSGAYFIAKLINKLL